jgi:hypothetical protein
MAIVTHIGVLASEPVNGDTKACYNEAQAVATSTNSIESSKGLSNSASAVATASNDLSASIVLSNSASAVSKAKNRIFAEFTNLQTAKLSDYTIFEPLQDHVDYANDNLISQFKDCPNILKLLNTSLLELDQATTDLIDFQKLILNVEEAVGAQLDLIGTILGLNRVLGQDDIEYRSLLLSQIQVITCDGGLTKVLAALLMRYNYPLDDSSRDKLKVRTLFYNIAQIYVHNLQDIRENGGTDFIDSLISGGGEARILVSNTDTTPEGSFFTLENSTIFGEGSGKGLGSLEAPGEGGGLSGTYFRSPNNDLENPFGLEGSVGTLGLNLGRFTTSSSLRYLDSPTEENLNQAPLPTTTSTVPVPTFGN